MILIERLNDVVVLRQSLAKAVGEHDLAVGKMAEDLARFPLARRKAALQSLRTETYNKFSQPARSLRNHSARVAIAKIGRVGVCGVGHNSF